MSCFNKIIMLIKCKGSVITLLFLTVHSFSFAAPPQSNDNQTNVQTIVKTREPGPILIVVSYDGFRKEYMHRNVTPNMLKFRSEGVYTDNMLNVFPTKTFTNHFTISTGLYPDVHGVLGNSLYDTVDGPLGYSYKLFHYSNTSLPIWIVNEEAGGHSGCMMWPGTNFEYSGKQCTHIQAYDSKVPMIDRVDTVMKWLTDPEKPANLVMLYSDQPDKLAHVVGPDSENITEMVASLDVMTKYIQDQLVLHNLEHRANVIHLSDHGMAGVPPSRFINLTDFLEPETFNTYGTSPVLQIVPVEGKLEDVYQRLKEAAKSNGNFDVYKTEELPPRWHATNYRRFGPIIAIAKMEYAFDDMWKYVNPNSSTAFGVHGYDNAEELMNPIFMAKGPLIKSGGQEMNPFETVDLFYLFTKILGIEDSNLRNGSASRVSDILVEESHGSDTTTVIIGLLIVGAILAVIIYVIKFKKTKSFYSPA